mmetsp:Transcript_2551/g.5455  ORF Transcript_2551/g.5455 Transcript_2551/m.5455 type:complete len:305 (+) Transcript_2551:131-1045(+)|eukprot:CAMPEP_0172321944 /NCGR_PEP_ID=MMETSP1058-20130122/44713_1 /TAXON_ID=83371 /ORGANISM="Detonula confervacea, Strain CCMP 353" /LENGTH=304 /DNA_ID=CAMNT_0013037569 /DNA_START=110 /DNA_END=1024 /DNA_ORIENTATION=+
MSFQRVAFAAAIFLVAQHPQDVSGFGVNPITSKRVTQSTTVMRAEPSASEKAAELRKKAEAAKKKATELKKVAEKKAEAAMMAVKKANDRNAAANAPKKPTPPTPKSEAPKADKASTRSYADPSLGGIIPINEETVEFTSGVLAGALALAFGASPVLAVVAAAAANYISKKDGLGELNEFVQGVTKASLNTFNWFGRLDSKYTILGKLTDSLDKSLDDLKNSEGENAETLKKIEETISKTTRQIQELADEIDFIEGGKQALGAVGDVVETTIDKAVGVNKEYKLSERAADAAKKAMDKAKEKKE